MSLIPSLDERLAALIQPMRPKGRYSRRKLEVRNQTVQDRRNAYMAKRLKEIALGCDEFFLRRNLSIPSASHHLVNGTGEDTSVRKFVSRLKQSRTQPVDP